MKEINIGILVNTHGLRGEVKVKCLSDFPELRFRKGAKMFIHTLDGKLELCVERVRESKGLLIVKFKDYDDINQVEAWKGSKLTISEQDLQELDEYEAYYHQMMDASVYDMDNNFIGKVIEVIETGANAVLRVQTEEKDILIPFVRTFVKEFDRKGKIMRVELMEGLV